MLCETIRVPVGSLGEVSLNAYCPSPDPACPSHLKRPAVVICPGGGYQRRDFNEEEPVALAMAARGICAFTVQYHVLPERFPRPQLDTAAALHYLKTHPDRFWLDPERIALAGFSSGGHLAACIGVLGSRKELWDAISLDWHRDVRPHLLVLGYPVITAGPHAHRESFVRLTGSDDPQEHAPLSLENWVSPDTPKTFLWHTWTDGIVPVQNSLLFASVLARHGVKAEVHLYPNGPHGISLANSLTADPVRDPGSIVPEAAGWLDLAVRFICTE